MRKIRFPRCVVLLEGQFKSPLLMVLEIDARGACCPLVFLQWERDDYQLLCRLVAGKTQVDLKVKITYYPKDKVGGSCQFCQASQEGERVIENSSCQDEILNKLLCGSGIA
jgi:hypothetical protein